jgi:hypothetical protein
VAISGLAFSDYCPNFTNGSRPDKNSTIGARSCMCEVRYGGLRTAYGQAVSDSVWLQDFGLFFFFV